MSRRFVVAATAAGLLAAGCAVGPMHMPSDSKPSGSRAGPGLATAVSPEHLDVRFAREDVIRIVRAPEGDVDYPDLITFKGREKAERGLVLETTPASVLLRLPREARAPVGVTAVSTTQPGGVSGKVIRKGKPLPGCEVRITGLERSTFLVFESVRSGSFERRVVTDEHGVFVFDGLPPGPYRLAFRRAGTNSWLIRLREVPVDAFVEDLPINVGVINLGKPTLN